MGTRDRTDGAAPAGTATVAQALVRALQALGVREAYGVPGGAMAALWHAMSASTLRLRHCRHETGAAFAAMEAHFATDRPVLLFTTTGPGLCNALTGLLAARADGARLVLVSACTSAATRGRGAIQESTRETLPRGLYEAGPLFDQAVVLDDPAALGTVLAVLADGLRRPQGWIAHVAVPTAVATRRVLAAAWPPERECPDDARPQPITSHGKDAAAALLEALRSSSCALWLGHGARHAAAEVRELVERTSVPAFCTPRAKGILPETHPRFVGVTGIGGHGSVAAWMQRHAPRRVIVLGSRLGEASSLLDPRMIPPGGFVHVDTDPAVFGAAYPEATTQRVVGDIGTLLRQVLARLPAAPLPHATRPQGAMPCAALPCSGPALAEPSPRRNARVRPEVLMDHLQRLAIDEADATVLADSGNAFVWTTHRLRFHQPGRHRVSTAIGAMGHACAGAVGAALADPRRVVAVVGDGALLMHNEINTAVKYGARVVWVVLNDARWGMCAQGMQALGLQADASFPAVDFAAFARAQGAHALRVDREDHLEGALRQALAAPGPCLLDVQVDTEARAPACGRNRGLAQAQEPASAAAAATAPAAAAHPEPAELAFPAR